MNGNGKQNEERNGNGNEREREQNDASAETFLLKSQQRATGQLVCIYMSRPQQYPSNQ